MRQVTPDGQIHVSVTHMRAPAYPLGRDHARNAREATHGAQRRCRVAQNEALETVRTTHGQSIRPLAAAGRARECNRPWQQVRWLRRSLLGVSARHHTGHRLRLGLECAGSLQLQHRVDDSRASSEAVPQPVARICSAAEGVRLAGTGPLALTISQRLTFARD